MARTVFVDRECCIGCGTCAELCPDVFELDEEEKSQVIQPTGGSDKDCVDDAIDACPASCISWQGA